MKFDRPDCYFLRLLFQLVDMRAIVDSAAALLLFVPWTAKMFGKARFAGRGRRWAADFEGFLRHCREVHRPLLQALAEERWEVLVSGTLHIHLSQQIPLIGATDLKLSPDRSLQCVNNVI